MPQFSTAPAYKTALITALKARPGLAGVQITYGFLIRGLRNESIAVGSIEWEDEKYAAVGNRRKEENYWVNLWVWVSRKGRTQQEATERVFALLAEIEVFLRETPIMVGVNWAQVEPVTLNEAPLGKEGYSALAEARIRVKARK